MATSSPTSSNQSPITTTKQASPSTPTKPPPTLASPIALPQPSSTPPLLSLAQPPPQPTITLVKPSTEADIETPIEMKDKTNPTDSETALLSNGTNKPVLEASTSSSTPGTAADLTRQTSARAQPKEPSSNKPDQPTSTPLNKPTTTPAPKPSASRQTPTQKASQKKKRKRKGLAGLLLALGCLSASEFEDEPKKSGAKEVMVQKPSEKVTVPSAAKVDESKAGDVGVGTSKDTVGRVNENTDTTLVDKAAVAPEVVVAPTEPVAPPIEETEGMTSSAVQPPGSGSNLLPLPPARRESDAIVPATTSNVATTETSGGYSNLSDSDAADEQQTQQGGEYLMDEEYEDEEDRLIAQGGMGLPLDEDGLPAPLLPVMDKQHRGRKCLVLDLDETLLHSSFKMIPSADYIVPVEIESQTHNVYVIKRPGVDNFLREMGEIYEIVVFTASLSKYADPVLDMLDVHRVVRHRLFRESCYNHKGNYVKDLSQLGREMEGCIIIDNSPASYIFHPNNAVPVSTWFNDPHDTELTDLCPFLADLATVDDIRGVLDGSL